MRKFYTGIDIGTHQVKVVIAAPPTSPDLPMQILGTGTASSRSMRHGYIMDAKEAAKSVKEALERASSAAKIKVTTARVGVGGVGLDELRSTGDVTLTQSGGVVTPRDMERAVKEAEKRAGTRLVNRTMLHAIPLEYRVDGSKVFGKPDGLQGAKLSVDALLITLLSQHHDDVVDAVEATGVEVEGVMASPIASSFVTLTKAQKTAGVVLANIGAETLSIIVFDNDSPVSIKVFPSGSGDITNSIALSFQVPLPEAEQLKRGAVSGSEISQKKMQALITNQLKDMFTLVNVHLKSIGRQRLLPAGIIITGGGAGLINAPDIARTVLRLPSQLGQIGQMPRSATVDATWAVAYGLCRWAFAEDMSGPSHTIIEIVRDGWDSLLNSVRSLLP